MVLCQAIRHPCASTSTASTCSFFCCTEEKKASIYIYIRTRTLDSTFFNQYETKPFSFTLLVLRFPPSLVLLGARLRTTCSSTSSEFSLELRKSTEQVLFTCPLHTEVWTEYPVFSFCFFFLPLHTEETRQSRCKLSLLGERERETNPRELKG